MARLKPEMHPLLGSDAIGALFGRNIYTTLDFLDAKIKHIAVITNLSHKDILMIRNHIINKNSAVVKNGLDYYDDLVQKSAMLSTGIQSVDDLLQGGLVTGNIYEVCGLPSSGKTQFCLTLAKNVVKNLDSCIYYIDTKGDFSGKRILAMLDCERNMGDEQIAKIMSKILVKQVDTKYELVNCLYEIQNELNRGLKVRLVIIDSLPPLFYQSTDSVKSYGIMNQFVNIMRFLAAEYHVAFVVTNVVTVWYINNFESGATSTEKLGLGKYWSDVANVRIMMKRRSDGNEYELAIVKNYGLCELCNCTVSIKDVGVC